MERAGRWREFHLHLRIVAMPAGPARLVFTLPCLALALGAAPALAQGFEGVVTMKLNAERGPTEVTQQVKGDKVRMDMRGEGPGGVMLLDAEAQTMTMIMPSEKMYMVMDMKGMADQGAQRAEASKVTKLGTSATIAGRPCDNYLVGEKQDVEVCAAKGLGFFMMGGGPGARRGAMGRMAGLRNEAILKEFKDGFYPLRITEVSGGNRKVILEVTKIEPKTLDASLFQVPAGYQQMSMPGMGPGRP